MKNEPFILHFLFRTHSSFRKAFLFSVSFGFAEALLHSTFFIYLPLYVVVALAEVVWEPPLTLAPRVSPYQVSLVSVMVGEE